MSPIQPVNRPVEPPPISGEVRHQVPNFLVREHCPACGGSQHRVLLARSYADAALRSTLEGFYGDGLRRGYHRLLGATFALHECTSCGLIFQREVPDEELLATLYEEWIDPAAARVAHETNTPPAVRLDLARDVFLAVTLTDTRRSWRSLDYGCGWGDWSMMTHAFGAEPWGTEISPTRRDYSAHRGVHLVDEGALPASSFAVINLNQILEHVLRPRETLRRLVATLEPDGIIRIAVPSAHGIKRNLLHFDRELTRPQGGRLYAVAPLQHISCFSSAALIQLAAACGLHRVTPTWNDLLASARLSGALKPTLKAMVRPIYLRSRFATDLFFRKAPAPADRMAA